MCMGLGRGEAPYPAAVTPGHSSCRAVMIRSVFASLTTDQWIQVAIVGITAVAALAAAVTAWITLANERKRTQPIVIAHESRGRHLEQTAAAGTLWVVDAYLTSEGAGPAFNVRFGVEFHGVRYPYRLTNDDPSAGNVQRVLAPGARRPEQGTWAILLTSSDIWGLAAQGGAPDPGRLYWARFENAQGKTWETRNPGDRSARLDMHRVHFLRLKEWREERRRHKARKESAEWERKALEGLRKGMEQAQRQHEDEQGDGR